MKTVMFVVAALLTAAALLLGGLFLYPALVAIAVYLVLSTGSRVSDWGATQTFLRVLVWGAVFTTVLGFRSGASFSVWYVGAAVFVSAGLLSVVRGRREKLRGTF